MRPERGRQGPNRDATGPAGTGSPARTPDAEEQLRLRLQEYETLLQNTPDVVARFDRDLRHLYVSPSILRVTGLPAESFLGRTDRELGMPAELVDAWEATLREVFRTGAQGRIDFRFPGAGGDRHYEGILSPEIGPEGDVLSVVAVNRDVTGRKRAEAALQESDARYRSLVESSGDAILLTIPDGRILGANPAACRMFGMTEAEICRAGRSGLVDTDDPRLAAAVEVRARTGRFAGELRFRRKGGEPFEGEVSTVVFADRNGELCTSMIIREITERKRAEAALQASRDFLRGTLDALSEHIAILDEDGTIAAVNAAWMRFPATEGLDGEAPGVGASYLAVCEAATGQWAEEAPVVSQAIREIVAGRRDEFRIEYPCHSPERRRWFALRASRFVAGGQVRVVVAHEDITLRREVEAMRRGASAQLLRVQEAERRHLARELHDEVGQLLTGIRLNLDLAAELGDARMLPRVREALGLADELLARVRQLSMDLRPSLLDDLGLLPALLWHIDRLAARSRASISLQQTGLDGRRFPVEVETTVYRIVQEGLTNAVRHAPGAPVTVRVAVEGERLSVRIEDEGPGFDLERLAGGAGGNGLHGMRERAELLGGRLEIETSPGAGCRLRVEMPLGLGMEAGEGAAQ